jgi:hypothetical protein
VHLSSCTMHPLCLLAYIVTPMTHTRTLTHNPANFSTLLLFDDENELGGSWSGWVSSLSLRVAT